ncbi:MAG: Lrp/AsnC ligand binding domain-containing protein [Bacteroidales bacterium]|nr:Lrp/AsnC ligand binding domain-containing protein [Bacteroidales bacterium]
MNNNVQIDNLDKKILKLLTQDARLPFLEVARKCNVSGAAVHQRINRMMESGIITGSHFAADPKALGFSTLAFIGIQVNLTTERTHEEVFERIAKIPEIVECHHITGKYSLLIKIYARNNEDLKRIIIEKIQSIVEVVSTETFISLEEGFTRELPVE